MGQSGARSGVGRFACALRDVGRPRVLQRVAAVLRRQPDKPVLVRGDHAADYGSVVAAMVLLQQAGIRGVGLVTESPEAR